MIQICLVISLVIISQGQMVKGHALPLQAIVSQTNATQRLLLDQSKESFEMDYDSSGMEPVILDVPECDGTKRKEDFGSLISDPGCYVFQTTGFNDGGYADADNDAGHYTCSYGYQFEAGLTGTVTVKKDGFEFPNRDPTTGCSDFLTINGVNDTQQENDQSDPDDISGSKFILRYCGTLNEDKIRNFENQLLYFDLTADSTDSRNGAEILFCVN